MDGSLDREDVRAELERLRNRVRQLESAEGRAQAGSPAGHADDPRLVAIIESTSDLVSTSTPDGRLTYMNRAGRELLGWSESEVLERAIPDVHSARQAERILTECIPIAVAAGEWRGESALLKADGTELPVSQVILVHRDAAGEIEFYSTIMRDLSAVKAALAQLRESKEMLQIVTDSVPQQVFWKDRDSIYIGCNRHFARVAGLADAEDIVGKSDFDLPWTREQSERFRESDRRAMEADEAEYHIIEPQTQADGRVAWLDSNKVPLHDDAGAVVGILGTYEDVTENLESQRALTASEENLRITLRSIGDAVIATDAGGRVTRMNPVAEELTGWCEEEALGRPLSEVFQVADADTRELVEDPVERILERGDVIGNAHHSLLLSADGVERQIADRGAPIRNGEGEFVGVVLVFRDITEQLSLEEQLRQVQKMESIGQLAGGVAHDFNNMLAGIMGSAELLAPDLQQNPQHRKLVDTILEAAESAAGLTQRLLDFSRKGRVTSRPLDLHRVVRDVVELLGRSIDRRIQIDVALNATQSIVLGDSSQLQNAVLNLGVNARDAMPDGGELTFETRNARGPDGKAAIELRVRDTGTGIDPEHLERIFEPFFTTKEVGRGTGLGLAAVYGTVQVHQGVIEVESQLELGTAFRILLPVEQARAEDSEPTTPAPRAALEGAHGPARVLVVDDELVVRHSVEKHLLDLGYQVVLAEDGAAAVECFRREHADVDLVLLDTVMPRMGGRDAYREMLAIDESVRVLFMSGFTRDASGYPPDPQVVGFLKKPFRIKELATLVARGLEAGSASTPP